MKRSPISYALWLLGRRAYSVKEMTERIGRHFPPEVVDEIVDRLRAQQLLNDEKMAEQFVQSRLTVRHQGRFRISLELAKRGIDRDLAKTAVATVTDEAEIESARELLARRLKTWQNLDDQKRRYRAISLLARRGFAPGVIKKVTTELLNQSRY